jgi:hypothetical protein
MGKVKNEKMGGVYSDLFIHKLSDGAGPMTWKMREAIMVNKGSLKYANDFADLQRIYCGFKGTAR